MTEDDNLPGKSEHDRLLAENRLLAQRYLELESASRKQIEKLRSANALLTRGEADIRILLENADIGFALLDLNMRVVSANPTLCDLLGQEQDEISGENFNNFVYVGKLPVFTRITGQTAERSRVQESVDLVARDGRLVPCRVVASDWLDDDGVVRGLFLLVLGMDDEMRAAARLRELETTVAETGKSRDLFLEVIGRELRAPATGIMGMVRMLMEDGLSDRQSEIAGIIHSSANSLVRIIDDIVDVVRTDVDALPAAQSPVDASALVKRVRDLFLMRAEEKGLEFRIHVSAAVPERFLSDPALLRRALVHLVDNAVRYTDRGHVSLTVDLMGDSLRFMVSDTGRGIGVQEGRDLFGDYIPYGKYPGADDGIGVGLPLARRIVNALGGKIGYESEPGRGSEFHFTIPAIVAGENPRDDVLQPPLEALHLPPLSILLADANPLGARLVKAYLQFDGHRLAIVDNGLEAAEKCRHTSFDVVLLDLHLPKLDGLQTLRLIRDDEKTGGRRRTPALILAPFGQLREKSYYERAGADGVIGKPVRPVDLMTVLSVATGAAPLTVSRRPAPEQYAAQASGGALRRIDPVQLSNLRQILPREQFLGLLRFFMEDAVPGVIELSREAADRDSERVAFAAVKYRALSSYFGFSSLAELLKRLETAARAGAERGELEKITDETRQAMDDSLEELKRILPEAFSTISSMARSSGETPSPSTD